MDINGSKSAAELNAEFARQRAERLAASARQYGHLTVPISVAAKPAAHPRGKPGAGGCFVRGGKKD